ncbi:MAG: hypothetical protein DHS80DRAFT_31825 [Piptocephalis tieghemiana]|nr:MAG: hypothetical protein DHS80DRAFT_31825 [Piptocephalis tieghemiana]
MSYPSTPLGPLSGTPFIAPVSQDLFPILAVSASVLGLILTGAYSVTRSGIVSELSLALFASIALGFGVVFSFLYAGLYV